jgi:hypothetical protein
MIAGDLTDPTTARTALTALTAVESAFLLTVFGGLVPVS